MPNYIQKRRKKWYAVLDVPKALKSFIGKPRYVHSLDTDSEEIALRRAPKFIAQWKAEIAAAKSGSRDHIDQDHLFWRKTIEDAKRRDDELGDDDRVNTEVAKDHLEEHAEKLSRTKGIDAVTFFHRATGDIVDFDEHIDDWKSSSRVQQKTKDMQKADVLRFAKKFETVQSVNRKEVRRWFVSLAQEHGLKPKTLDRIASALRGYWKYLGSIEIVDEESRMFNDLGFKTQAKAKSGQGLKRRAFEPHDIIKLQRKLVRETTNNS